MPPAVRKKVVVVTGSSRGLGREIALAFAKTGGRVVVNYVSCERAASEVVKQITDAGGEAFSFKADVGEAADVEAMFIETTNRWKTLDVLINNAGTTRDGLVLRMQEQDWDAVLDTNLKGAFYCIRAAARVMTRQGYGHIINIASIAGLQGREGQANYACSKAGLIGLSRACARELGSFSVKINTVLPGYMPTEMGDAVSQSIRARVLKENALNRVSDPKEVAQFICHLATMNNVSGQVFNLDSRIP